MRRGECAYEKMRQREREGACTREGKGASERASERHAKKDERYERGNVWEKRRYVH